MTLNKKNFLLYYCKERRVFLVWQGITMLVFLAVAALYNYKKVAYNLMYCFVILLFLLFCGLVADYWRYYVKNKELLKILDKGMDQDSSFPVPGTLSEAICQEIIQKGIEEKRELLTDLDEKKQDMSDYYTMWTHQIKTPIAALNLLLDGEAQKKNELFKIQCYAEMALYYARLDSISSDMLFEEYDIPTLIKGVIKKYSSLFIAGKISLNLESFELVAVTDQKWFSFALEQIISNALKYTQAGEIHIYGCDRNGNADKQICGIVIEDTGIGIRESDLPRIFERGFTGYNGRMDRKSTGIGLYLSKQIFTRLSHTIAVASTLGAGTKVTIGNMTKL